MKIGLFYNQEYGYGPGKVASNLVKGLRELGHDVVVNQEGDVNGCLQSWGPRYRDLPAKTLMGPNLMTLPSDHPAVWKRYRHFIVPSIPVLELYSKFRETEDCSLHVWASGIDTDRFRVERNPIRDVLVYFKNRNPDELGLLVDELNSRGLSFEVLSYGHYSENDFLRACSEAAVAVVLDGAESQGIAIMEMMSMNVPLYVLNGGSDIEGYNGVTAPYFDETCGIIGTWTERFQEFLTRRSQFNPRSFVENGHTLRDAALSYLKLLEISHAD